MPHTVMQASVKEILENKHNEEHLKSRLEIMRRNEHLLADNLGSLHYCEVGSASGALYGTILLEMDHF